MFERFKYTSARPFYMAMEFLPDTKISYLRAIEKKEKDFKAKIRILACISRKEGKSIEEISKTFNVPYTTMQNWLKRIEKGGIKNRYDIKNKGAECKLNRKQRRQLARDMDKSPEKFCYGTSLWTTKLVTRHIKNEFGVEYHIRSTLDLVHRLGFRRIKPRPVNPKAATPEEREAFKKHAREQVEYWSKKGYVVLVQDEAHIVLAVMPRKGWFRSKKPTITTGRVKGSKNRVSIIGAIGIEGIHHFEVYSTANWNNFKDFLEKVHKKYGKVLMFLDNASYHRKKELEKITEETNGDMQFVFLPSYTPELNPIETQWPSIKGNFSGIMLHDAKHVQNLIQLGIERKIISIAKLHDYYIPKHKLKQQRITSYIS